MITAEATHQHLAEGFPVGMRFHSAPVLRLADAKPVELGHVARADGAWRVYVFADADGTRVRALCEFLESDRRAGSRRRAPTRTPSSTCAPSSSRPTASWTSTRCHRRSCRGRASSASSTTRRRSAPTRGRRTSSTCAASTARCAIVVRPDGYVADVLPLDAHEELAGFLDGVLLELRASQRSPTKPTRTTTRVARVGSASETKSRTGAW